MSFFGGLLYGILTMGRGTGGSTTCGNLFGDANRITLVALLEHGFDELSMDKSMVSITGNSSFSRDVDGLSLALSADDNLVATGLTLVSGEI